MRWPTMSVGLFVVLVGCSSEDTICSSSAAPLDGMETATPGQLDEATDQFVAVEERPTFPLQHGIQGGQHINVSVRFYATDGRNWAHELVVTDTGSNTELGRTAIEVEACSPGWTETHSIRVVLEEEGSRDAMLKCSVSRLDDDDNPIRSLEAEWMMRIADDS